MTRLAIVSGGQTGVDRAALEYGKIATGRADWRIQKPVTLVIVMHNCDSVNDTWQSKATNTFRCPVCSITGAIRSRSLSWPNTALHRGEWIAVANNSGQWTTMQLMNVNEKDAAISRPVWTR